MRLCCPAQPLHVRPIFTYSAPCSVLQIFAIVAFVHSAADKRWAPGTVAAASAAARLAVQGLCTALGALQADVAASSKADLLSLLCTMKEAAEHRALQGVDLLPAVDQAASTLSALL